MNYPVFRLHLGGDYWLGPFTIYHREIDGRGWIHIGPKFMYVPVEGASPFSFRALTDGYGSDASHVYLGSTRIEADPRTFVVLSRGYARDDHSVFRNDLRTARDASSFVVLPDGYTKDRRSVQRDDDAPLWKLVMGRKVPFDAASFNSLGCEVVRDATGFYVVTEERSGRDRVGLRLINLDSTFEFLRKGCVARDARFVYNGIDLESQPGAALMTRPSPRLVKDLGRGYSLSTQGVQHGGRLLQDADTATFKIIGDGYSRDSKHVFYGDRVVPEADAATFEIIGDAYSRDGKHVFYEDRVVPEAEPHTFQALYAPYAHPVRAWGFDGPRIYREGRNIDDSPLRRAFHREYETALEQWHRDLDYARRVKAGENPPAPLTGMH